MKLLDSLGSFERCCALSLMLRCSSCLGVSQINVVLLHLLEMFGLINPFFPCRELNRKTKLKFVHTAFHGVGHDYVQLAFQAFGFQPPIPVPEQKDPDPDFSTVKCPNPEEGESVLVSMGNNVNSVVSHTGGKLDYLSLIDYHLKWPLPGTVPAIGGEGRCQGGSGN